MAKELSRKLIKGISVANPVEVERDYLLYTVDYAAKKGFDHIQIIGPIHDHVKGNIDGMVMYDKYSEFNNEKDAEYVALSIEVVNEACKRADMYNIKTYMWHHELYLPNEFKRNYSEVINDYGDVEVSHPLVKDFLENKIRDFFNTYPMMNGIILTLHETSIPLLKLKKQKLGKIERVKYVTKILYDACKMLGKELIVRPFASVEEDYAVMTKAYEDISNELYIMDKWTQFDWSLTMPSNRFYSKIQNNPLFVEADIFGEFFGKGRLPLMLKEHIKEKFEYCSKFEPVGYVARIDRNGQVPFDDVNEVNIEIMNAHLDGRNPDDAINNFFESKYHNAASKVRELMENTEEILKKTIYIRGYLFSELSIFPTLNHCKNHYYFEMMRKNALIDSNEWYIPLDWNGYPVEEILLEKQEAVEAAESLFGKIEKLKGEIPDDEYNKLWIKFCNLKLVTKIWQLITLVHINYVQYFETKDEVYLTLFEKNLECMLNLSNHGKELLGDKFYCINGNDGLHDYVNEFVNEIRHSFHLELEASQIIECDENVVDYIVCGGALEGHCLQKEVNFSDTLITEKGLCRIPGNRMGDKWSTIKAHGWFSYAVNVKPNAENTIKVVVWNSDNRLDLCISIGNEEHIIGENVVGKKEFTFAYTETSGNDIVRIRFDKISGYTPYIYEIKVY